MNAAEGVAGGARSSSRMESEGAVSQRRVAIVQPEVPAPITMTSTERLV